MSSPIISITPHTRLPQIKHLLRAHNIRRLPVVDRNRLVGIVTLGDVRNAFPSDTTTLRSYDRSDLLDKVTAQEVMRTEVITIAPDALLIEAVKLMLQHKVSGLPVVDSRQVVGIITESDIFRAVIAGHVPLAVTVVIAPKERALGATEPIV
jgi:acetoin utilization protein AcuB